MTDFTFQKATKKQLKARVAIDGPSGSGKTYTALIAATTLAQGGKIAVIDTERGSASLYSDKFNFDVLELNPPFSPEVYTKALNAAENAGYSVVVIDSLSHAWEGEGGALDMADAATQRQQSRNSYTAWREVTPIHRDMVDAILQSPAHIIATMRSKMEYVQEKDANNKTIIRKVGMAPIQRAGMEYEFTLVGDMDLEHNIVISKSRCEVLADAVQKKPDHKFFQKFVDWLNSGESYVAAKVSTHEAEKVALNKESKPVENNGNKYSRPMSPEVLKEAISIKATKKGDCTDQQRRLVQILLDEYFAGNTADRHAVQQYLTGSSSSKNIPGNVICAILDWMAPTVSSDGSGSYVMSKDARVELGLVKQQALVDMGQEVLFPEATNAA